MVRVCIYSYVEYCSYASYLVFRYVQKYHPTPVSVVQVKYACARRVSRSFHENFRFLFPDGLSRTRKSNDGRSFCCSSSSCCWHIITILVIHTLARFPPNLPGCVAKTVYTRPPHSLKITPSLLLVIIKWWQISLSSSWRRRYCYGYLLFSHSWRLSRL